VGASCEAAYSASKAGLIGLTKALAKELAPSGVRVNCVAPGVIRTPMLKDFSEEELEDLRLETPLEMLGEPEDVAALTAYLASEEARFMTGQVIGLNGGFVIT
jgi:3-oxoacyl-[acyl-carrier protein] reductase